jgi:hypothetical protein
MANETGGDKKLRPQLHFSFTIYIFFFRLTKKFENPKTEYLVHNPVSPKKGKNLTKGKEKVEYKS